MTAPASTKNSGVDWGEVFPKNIVCPLDRGLAAPGLQSALRLGDRGCPVDFRAATAADGYSRLFKVGPFNPLLILYKVR
jgi:hypothetical protein